MAYVWICCHECESVWVFLPLSFSKLFTWPCDDVVSKTHFTLIRHECESVWIEHRHRCFIVVLLAFHSISFCVTFLFMHCQGIQMRLACVCCAVNTNGRGNINLWTFCTISFNVARIVERFIIVRNHRRHWFTIATVWVGEILRDSSSLFTISFDRQQCPLSFCSFQLESVANGRLSATKHPKHPFWSLLFIHRSLLPTSQRNVTNWNVWLPKTLLDIWFETTHEEV